MKRNVILNKLTFENYKKCIFENEITSCEQSSIRSKNHNVYTVCETKIALRYKDDKRWHFPDSVETLPWAHYKIKEIEGGDNNE